MVRTLLPESPSEILACDLLGPIDNNIVLVIIDYYSRWIEIDILKSVTSTMIIASLEQMFLTHGLPYVITSDNGPQFVSSQFKEFCERNGINHRRITLLWPQANAEIASDAQYISWE